MNKKEEIKRMQDAREQWIRSKLSEKQVEILLHNGLNDKQIANLLKKDLTMEEMIAVGKQNLRTEKGYFQINFIVEIVTWLFIIGSFLWLLFFKS